MVNVAYSSIRQFADRRHDLALLLLRFGLGTVLFYFGITGLLDYNSTLSWIAPQFKTIISSLIPLKLFAYVLTISQTLVATLLIAGLFTRVLGLAGFLMVLGIIINLFIAVGTVDDLIVRDIAIATAELILFFFGPGKHSVDRKIGLD